MSRRNKNLNTQANTRPALGSTSTTLGNTSTALGKAPAPRASSAAGDRTGRALAATGRRFAGIGRQSVGRDYNAYGNYLGIIPRRGWDDQTRLWMTQVQTSGDAALLRWAEQVPLRLLQVLTDLHPMASMATRNNTGLGLSPSDIKIVAEVPGGGGDIDEKGQAALTELWARLPAHFGGMIGLGRALMRQTLWSGMHCAEAILSEQALGGVQTVETFDPLSVRWRDTPEGRLLEQDQISAQLSYVLPGAVHVGALSPDGWRELPSETCFASPLDGDTDNPYGIPVYSAFLAEGLADIKDWKNIGDVMHAIVYPRLFFAFPFEQIVQFAKESVGTDEDVLTGAGPGGVDLTATEYAFAVQEQFKTDIQGLAADDQIFGIKGGEVKPILLAEGLRGLQGPLEMRRLRLAQSLSHPATMLGITQGGTQAYSSTEWQSYAKNLEAMRGHTVETLVKIASLHLRYSGINAIAKAEVAKIQTSDKKADEEARGLEIKNEQELIRMGFATGDDASVALTGTKIADPARFEAWLTAQSATTPTPGGVP